MPLIFLSVIFPFLLCRVLLRVTTIVEPAKSGPPEGAADEDLAVLFAAAAAEKGSSP
jgi:hypothetical protein